MAGLPARLAAHVQAAGLLLGVAEGVGVANGGGRAAARGVTNARRGGLEEGRPELDFIHLIASSRASVGFREVDLVPLVVLPGELWFLLVTVHDRRVGRGAHSGPARGPPAHTVRRAAVRKRGSGSASLR